MGNGRRKVSRPIFLPHLRASFILYRAIGGRIERRLRLRWLVDSASGASFVWCFIFLYRKVFHHRVPKLPKRLAPPVDSLLKGNVSLLFPSFVRRNFSFVASPIGLRFLAQFAGTSHSPPTFTVDILELL